MLMMITNILDNIYIYIYIYTCKCNDHDRTCTVSRSPHCRDSEYVSAKLFQQLMRAVAYMHTKHVVHRDIKPQNIMIEAAA